MIKENKQTVMDGQHQNTMLDYAKEILPKVRFSKELFTKELKKCIDWVEKDELRELYLWCHKKFGNIYPDVIQKAFANIAA